MMPLASGLCPWLLPCFGELDRALATGRLAHGWILAGPQGTGKLNLALVFAMRLLDQSAMAVAPRTFGPRELADALESRHLPQDHHPDLHFVGPEEGKKAISVDQIRTVIEKVALTGYSGTVKVVVIEPAERMTVQAANALLKSLEEPATGTHVLLVSHSIGRLPATIRSRCQTLTVRRPNAVQLRDWLADSGQSFDESNPLVVGEQVGPGEAAVRILKSNINDYNVIDSILKNVYENTVDVASAVADCRNLDLELVLEWIAARLRTVIRVRAVATGVTNSVTDPGPSLPQNSWDLISTSELFDLLRQTDQLRDLLGSGINEVLGLEVILAGFARS